MHASYEPETPGSKSKSSTNTVIDKNCVLQTFGKIGSCGRVRGGCNYKLPVKKWSSGFERINEIAKKNDKLSTKNDSRTKIDVLRKHVSTFKS